QSPLLLLFSFTDPPTSEIYTLSLHDALPIFGQRLADGEVEGNRRRGEQALVVDAERRVAELVIGDGREHGAGDHDPALGRHQLRSEEHTSELQSPYDLVCRLLLEKKKKKRH